MTIFSRDMRILQIEGEGGRAEGEPGEEGSRRREEQVQRLGWGGDGMEEPGVNKEPSGRYGCGSGSGRRAVGPRRQMGPHHLGPCSLQKDVVFDSKCGETSFARH